MKEFGATRDEVGGAWDAAHDEGRGMQSLWAWHKRRPEDIAQRIADYRQQAEYDAYDAEFAAHGICDFHRLPYPCRGCAADAKAVADV